MAELLTPILIIILLIIANGVFVAAEFAIAAAPRTRVAQMVADGSKPARHVLEILDDRALLNRYISTAQVGITFASLGLGMYGEHAVAEWLLHYFEEIHWLGEVAAHTISTVIAVSVLTYLHVVLGEMVPKSLSLQAAAPAAVYLSSAMVVAERLFRPLTTILIWVGNKLLTAIGLPPDDPDNRLISTAELAYIVEESTESGFLAPSEEIYLRNVIDFNERTVGQVMTPRTRMAALPVDVSLTGVLSILAEEGHARFPVYEKDRDHIIGIFHIKDLARRMSQIQHEGFNLADLIRPAVFVPESLGLDEMLTLFRKQHFQIAIVLDEYGGTAGIVTLEDLAEEIIGEIQDADDEEIPPFMLLEPQLLRVRGDLLLDELNQHFDVNIDIKQAETVGGLIMSELGTVPHAGVQVEFEGLTLQVEKMEGLAVYSVLIRLPDSPSTGAAGATP
jgi:CBS domain containing-hemolysin-like protein